MMIVVNYSQLLRLFFFIGNHVCVPSLSSAYLAAFFARLYNIEYQLILIRSPLSTCFPSDLQTDNVVDWRTDVCALLVPW
jgi:hypothetical protein